MKEEMTERWGKKSNERQDMDKRNEEGRVKRMKEEGRGARQLKW